MPVYMCYNGTYLHYFMYLLVSMSTSCVSQGMYAESWHSCFTATTPFRSHYGFSIRLGSTLLAIFFLLYPCFFCFVSFLEFFLFEWVDFPLLPEYIISPLLRINDWPPQPYACYKFSFIFCLTNVFLYSRERLFFLVLIVMKLIEFVIIRGCFIYLFFLLIILSNAMMTSLIVLLLNTWGKQPLAKFISLTYFRWHQTIHFLIIQ